MRLVRILKSWWKTPLAPLAEEAVSKEAASKEAGGEGRRPELERARVHRKMLLVVHYLESLRHRHPDLAFRYVGPNEMNGQAEELKVYSAAGGEGHSISIRYLDGLEVYFIEDPRDGRALRTDEGRILSSLADVLAEVFPQEDRRDLGSP